MRNRTVYWLLILVVLVSPLPFASNRPWAWSMMSLVVGLILVTWLVARLKERTANPVTIQRISWPTCLLLLACACVCLQVVPNVPEWLANPFWHVALDAGIEARPSISVSRFDTLTSLMRLLTYCSVFWLALQSFRDGARAKLTVLLLSIATAAYSGYGLILYFLGSNTILWFDKWAYLNTLTSTFVNRNSFATFAGLGLLCSVAYVTQLLSSGKQTKYGESLSLHRAVSAVSKFELPFFLAVAASLTSGTAVFLTASRGGVAAALVALFVFIIGMALRAKRSGRASLLLLTLVFVGGGLVFSLSGGRVEERLDQLTATGGLSGSQRAIVYERTVDAITDYPLLGTGYGTYADFFQSYMVAGIRGFFDRAHNTYLELALELGLPASILVISAIILLVWRCFQGLERRSSSFVWSWLGFCASVLVGTHALVDFGLQMPAIACLYATLLGLGVAQSWSASVNTSVAHTVIS